MDLVVQAAAGAGTAVGSLVVLFLLTKLMGAKRVSQMTPFDYITGITIGSVAGEMAAQPHQLVHALPALVVYGFAAVGISTLTSKSIKARTLVTGKPLVLLDEGVIYRENLKKAHLDLDEFLTFCRIGGWFDLNQLQSAVLEHNGAVSFLPREKDRPAAPADFDIFSPQSQLQIPFVMDGKVMQENVERSGKAESWVQRALAAQGYSDAAKVLLALWDGGEKLTVFPMDAKGKRG